jgi:hypothetical protein
MKKNFGLSNLVFFGIEVNKIVTPKFPTEFAVKIDDCGTMYLQSLVNILKTKSPIDKSQLNRLEKGDTVVFTKNEVYVEDCPCAVSNLRVTKLSLVKDYIKVAKSIENFFDKVFKSKKQQNNCCEYCPLQSTCSNTREDRIYDGQYITLEEKVSIMYNFVKVGYEQYDIVSLCNGKQFVVIEDEEFEIKKDRNGKKYLQLI